MVGLRQGPRTSAGGAYAWYHSISLYRVIIKTKVVHNSYRDGSQKPPYYPLLCSEDYLNFAFAPFHTQPLVYVQLHIYDYFHISFLQSQLAKQIRI